MIIWFAASDQIFYFLKRGESQCPKLIFFEKEYNAGEQPSKPIEWMEPMKHEFYNVMGWDALGRPTPEKLIELGLGRQQATADTD